MSHFLDRLTFFKRQVGAFSNERGLWRKARATRSPVAAWCSIVEMPEKRASCLSKRGLAGLVRARWDEVHEFIAAANGSRVKKYGPDREAAASAEASEDADALITHIGTRPHHVRQHKLPELIRKARRVEAVHRGNVSAHLLERIAAERQAHMRKQEQVLFHLRRWGGDPLIGQPTEVMPVEHDEHRAYLRPPETLAADFEAPTRVCLCGTWRAAYPGIRRFLPPMTSGRARPQ